ncbi:MAG: hypothetical protein AVDCRST_MAG01-01-3669, partial [uncultured Rubrobacteraceae bacterium]
MCSFIIRLPGLDERVDEDELALARHDVAAVLPARRVLAYVDGAPRQAEVRVGDREVLAEAALHQGRLQSLERVEVVAYLPQHEVRVGPQAHQRERPQEHLPAVLLDGREELSAARLPLLLRETAPQ